MEKVLKNYTILLLYTTILCFIISLPNYIFRDRDSYVYYAGYYDIIFEDYYSNGLKNLLFNEPIFLFINSLLANIFSPYAIPIVFTVFSFSVFFWFLYKKSKNLLMFSIGLIIYFTITYTFHLQFVILRQSIATSLLLIMLFYFKDYKKVLICCLLLGFIHSAFFFIFILLNINFLSLKYIRSEYTRIIFQFVLFFILGFLALSVASYLGIRQAERLIETDVVIGGGSWIVWLCATLYLIFYGDRSNKILYEYCLVGMIVFLSLYFSTPFVGRLFASFIPAFIIIMVSRFRYIDLLIALLLFLPYMYLVSNGILFDLSFAIGSDELSRFSFFSLI